MSIKLQTRKQLEIRSLLEFLDEAARTHKGFNRILALYASEYGRGALRVLCAEGGFTCIGLREKLGCSVKYVYPLANELVSLGLAEELGRFIVGPGSAVVVYGLPDTPPEEARRLIQSRARHMGVAVRLEDVQVLADAQQLAEEAAEFWGAAYRPWETGNEKLVPRTWLLQKAADRGLYPRNWDKVRAALRKLGWGVLEGI